MLVGSCLPTTAKIRIVLLHCASPGCTHVISAVSEAEALAALDAHRRWAYAYGQPYTYRQPGPHAE